MDETAQASGERRVRDKLVKPLQRRGLARPASLTVAAFEEMCADLCKRLAYMSDLGLEALEEMAASQPSGKDKDRFPIGQKILGWAGDIEPPGDSASPLIRKVFASGLGQDALREGWAPELLSEVRRTRRWPNAFVVSTVQRRADDAVRQLVNLDAKLARGEDLPPSDAAWRDHRRADLQRCQEIADLAGVAS